MTAPRDLRLRIVAAFILILCISQVHWLPVAVAALALTAAAAWSSGLERHLWHRLLHVEGFMLLLFLTLPLTMPGQPIFSLGVVSASLEGLGQAALIACKVSACVLVLMILLGDVEPARLGAALGDLGLPEPIARLIAMTARYLQLIRDEARRLHDAIRARGFRAGSNRHTWRSYGNLIGMLLVRALDRSRRIEEAMLCRGYGGRFPRRSRPAPTRSDWMRFTALAVLGIALIGVDRF
ncbi:MAG TPA: cobalt ECF transporter T component CbiQ [Kaistia sp.]|nr:cobalt ECF transporter T component CbiQ [Kaistia sp.]